MTDTQYRSINANEQRLPTLLIIPLIQIFVIVLLFIALINGQRELTVLGLIVVALLAGTKIWSRLSPARLHCETITDKQRGFPGETFIFTTRIRNAKILPVLTQLTVSFSKYFEIAEFPLELKKSCSLLWFQEAIFRWHLNALRRGVYRLGWTDFRAGDLFGFYSRKLAAHSRADVIIYPRLVPIKTIRLPRQDLFGVPGFKSPIEDPVYVCGTRDYQSGRPARYIHWKASARLAKLQEKISEPATQEKIALFVAVDGFSINRAHVEFEKALEVAASAAVQFDRAGFAVGLVTDGELKGGGSPLVPIGRGGGQIPKLLETLARLQMKPAAKLGDIMGQGLKLPWGTTVVNLVYDYNRFARDLPAFF